MIDWSDLLDQLEEPPLGTVAEALADARDLDISTAYDTVEEALAEGDLVEEDTGAAFEVVALPEEADTDDTPKTPDSGDMEGRGGRSEPSDPQGNDAETTDDLDKYRRVYLDAAERAGREPWEPVEEEAIREALAAIGFEELLDNGTLFEIHRWNVVDLSDTGEDARRRWYYPSGDEPRPDEFRRFDALLREAAPDDYEPHYFRVARAGKDPATQYGSWKTDDARVTVEEAVNWMKEGGNVGVAGRGGCRECGGDGRVDGHACSECDGSGENAAYDGPLVNVDIDDDEETTPDDVPTSLRARSRSRTGWHTWFFDEEGDIPNIPTDQYGEVRTNWQYVVAPGSFVASCREEIPDDAEDPGYYTVEDEEPVASVEYDDLPEVFRDVAEENEEAEEEVDEAGGAVATPHEDRPDDWGDDHDAGSAVFDVEAADLVSATHDNTDRFSSIFHGSGTGANMSVSGNKVHCWRHGVAHGGLQALATLSDVGQVSTYGCGDLGAEHKNSNAGSNRLKGDWRLVWGAWHEAKTRGEIPDDDPIPYRVLRGLAVEDDLVAEEELVERDADTGEVADEDAEDTEDTYQALPSGTYNGVLDHVRDEYGVDPGREAATGRDRDDEGDGFGEDDPREVSVTVDARRAWDAAGRVTPSDLDDDRLQATAEAADSVACPRCGAAVDVVRAVAVEEGLVGTCEEALDEAYPEAYTLAREEYGAPIPEYYTTADAVAEFDAVLDVIGEVTFWHLDTDVLDTEITASGDDVDGEAVRALNPSWRDSKSEESVLVFESGTVWDADTERVLDALRFVALDSGLLDDPREGLEGSQFTEAYALARTEYGAPLPRWKPALDGSRDLTPQLPPAEDLLDAREVDGVGVDELEAARENVETLIREAASDADTPSVVTALPALGKTTGTIKTARDRALSYLAPRKELQAQALDKANNWGVDAEVLPVFADERVRDEVLNSAVAHVREHDKTRLRDREALLAAAADEDDGGIFVEDDEDDEDDTDDVDLDRATCPTAEGAHGDAWALAVHVARQAFGLDPSAIHTQARGLFGAPLPCAENHGDGEACEYSAAWEDIRDPADPADLLVGSYVHAHVDSVKTLITGDGDGGREYATRPVVLDEFPGEAYVRDFGAEAHDHATWLARSLRDDVEDRRDMYEADLGGDAWVRAWLDGDIDDDADDDRIVRAAEGARQLRRRAEVMEAAAEAADLLATPAAVLGRDHMTEALERLADDAEALGRDRRVDEVATLRDGLRRAEREADLPDWLVDGAHDALDRLAEVPEVGSADAIGDLPVGAAFREVVERATDYDTPDTLEAAATALEGGPDGCQRLAAWANDGYAHPDAHHLLEAVVTPTGADSDDPDGRRIHTDAWAFDPEATDGTVLDAVETHGNATTVLDRNDHGALLQTPPSRTSLGGGETPLVGLDATGRAELWRVALGEDVETADIHETPEERAAFLEDVLDLRVLEAADRPRYYSGDPGTKDTDGDTALLEAIAEEYAGIDAPRQRGDTPEAVGRPAAITSKGVREVLENDSRLDDVVAEWEHFGNLAGANDLGDHRLGAVLGCQHYGDDAIERFAALDGVAVDVSRDGARGAELSYDSDLGNEYLQHMTEDQVLQAILRFARGDSGATVVARTGALSPDLPVVGAGQVVETWSSTATAIARRYRRLGDRFTVADVADAVDVTKRQVRRVLAELEEAGYLQRVSAGEGVATVYAPGDQPGAGEVELAAREDAVDATAGRPASKEYYTGNVQVSGGETTPDTAPDPTPVRQRGAPPSPTTLEGAPGE